MASPLSVVLLGPVLENVDLGTLQVLENVSLHNHILEEGSATSELAVCLAANNSPQLDLASRRSLQGAKACHSVVKLELNNTRAIKGV